MFHSGSLRVNSVTGTHNLEIISLSCFICICSPVDEYGFHRPDDFDYKSYEDFMSNYLRVLARRASRWDRFMKGVNKVRKSRRGTVDLLYI